MAITDKLAAAAALMAESTPDPDILSPAAVERVMARLRSPEALEAAKGRRVGPPISPDAQAKRAAIEAERETVKAEAHRREAARAAAIADAYRTAPAPAVVKRGATVRGVFYRGPKRDRSNDPAYNLHTPRLIDKAVKERIVSPADGYYATAIYRHIRRTERFSEAARRLTIPELARLVKRSITVTREAVKRLIAAGFLTVIKPGGGRGVGAIYALNAR